MTPRCVHYHLLHIAMVMLIVAPLAAAANSECTVPTVGGSASVVLRDCSVSTADVVVNVTQLGMGGSRQVEVSGITLSGGYSIVIAGWLASSPIDPTRSDTGSLNVSITSVVGVGRVIIAGNFPNGTIVVVSSVSVALDSSATATPSTSSSVFGCNTSSTAASVLCITAPSLTYRLQLGPSLDVTNNMSQPGSGLVATAAVIDVLSTGWTSEVVVTGAALTVTSAASLSQNVAAVLLFRVVSGRLNTPLTLQNVTLVGTATFSSSVAMLGGLWILSGSSASALMMSSVTSFHTSNLLLNNVGSGVIAAVKLGGGDLAAGNSTSPLVSFGRSASLDVSYLRVTVTGRSHCVLVDLTDGVRTARGVAVTFLSNVWNATSLEGNATAVAIRVVAIFSSSISVASSAFLLSGASAAALVRLGGSVASGAQVVVFNNSGTLSLFNSSASPQIASLVMFDVLTPIGVLVAASMDVFADGTLFVGHGGVTFNTSTAPSCVGSSNCLAIALHGTASDWMLVLWPNSFTKVLGLSLYNATTDDRATSTTSAPPAFFSMDVNRVRAVVDRAMDFTIGCFRVDDVYPVLIWDQYMSDDTVDRTTGIIRCACTSTSIAVGSVSSVTGTYPNCVANCTGGAPVLPGSLSGDSSSSSALWWWPRALCVAPLAFTASATITTITRPRLITATTFTEFVSPTRGSSSLSSSLSPSQTEPHLSPTASATIHQSWSQLPWISASVTASPSSSYSLNETMTRGNLTLSYSSSVTASCSVVTTPSVPWSSHTASIKATPSNSVAAFSSTLRLTRNTTTITVAVDSKTVRVTRASTSISPSAVASSFSASHITAATTSWTDSPSQSGDVWSRTVLATLSAPISPTAAAMTRSLSGSVSAPSLSHLVTASVPQPRTRTGVLTVTRSPPPPPPPIAFLTESRALGFLTLALVTISSTVVGTPSLLVTQFLAVVGQSWATGDNAKQRTLPMAYIVSPFWDLSNLVVAVGNLLCIAVAVAAHVGFMLLRAPPRPTPPKSAASSSSFAEARFPDLSHAVTMVFYQGLVAAAFRIFYHESGAVFVMGAICLLVALAYPLLMYWLLFGNANGPLPEYELCEASSLSWVDKLVRPRGRWAETAATKSFGRLFSWLAGPGAVRFAGYPVLLALLVNAAASANAVNKSQRDAQFGVLGLLFLVASIGVAVFRPHRSHVANVVYVVAFVLLLMLCVCLANEASNAGAADGVPVIIVMMEVLMWTMGIFELLSWRWEARQQQMVSDSPHIDDATSSDAPDVRVVPIDDENESHTALSSKQQADIIRVEPLNATEAAPQPPPPMFSGTSRTTRRSTFIAAAPAVVEMEDTHPPPPPPPPPEDDEVPQEEEESTLDLMAAFSEEQAQPASHGPSPPTLQQLLQRPTTTASPSTLHASVSKRVLTTAPVVIRPKKPKRAAKRGAANSSSSSSSASDVFSDDSDL